MVVGRRSSSNYTIGAGGGSKSSNCSCNSSCIAIPIVVANRNRGEKKRYCSNIGIHTCIEKIRNIYERYCIKENKQHKSQIQKTEDSECMKCLLEKRKQTTTKRAAPLHLQLPTFVDAQQPNRVISHWHHNQNQDGCHEHSALCLEEALDEETEAVFWFASFG